jgi:hypothetical protein
MVDELVDWGGGTGFVGDSHDDVGDIHDNVGDVHDRRGRRP